MRQNEGVICQLLQFQSYLIGRCIPLSSSKPTVDSLPAICDEATRRQHLQRCQIEYHSQDYTYNQACCRRTWTVTHGFILSVSYPKYFSLIIQYDRTAFIDAITTYARPFLQHPECSATWSHVWVYLMCFSCTGLVSHLYPISNIIS